MYDLGILDSLGDNEIGDILQGWSGFCACVDAILQGHGDLSAGSHLAPLVAALFNHGLASLVQDHFLQSLEETFKRSAVSKFWLQFDNYTVSPTSQLREEWPQEVLTNALEDICAEKEYQEKCLLILVHAYEESMAKDKVQLVDHRANLFSRYQLMVASVLLTTIPSHFPDILRLYFRRKLEELSTMIAGYYEDGDEFHIHNQDNDKKETPLGIGEIDIDRSYLDTAIRKNNCLVKSIGKIVRDLRSLGFTSMTEDAYASAIFLLLKTKVLNLAGDDYKSPILGSIKDWIRGAGLDDAIPNPLLMVLLNLTTWHCSSSVICDGLSDENDKAVPLQLLHALMVYLGDSTGYESASSGLKSPLASRPSWYPGIDIPSEGLVRWQLRLEYFAYETLQDLRIGKLFEIIVDYPDSSPAIEDLKQCLDYTGQHSKLVDSFISALRYRLLTAGASTNDILHQYVSTIKALRTIDPTGIFLEAVGEPIRDYLRGRKDTIKCIVTMLTDGTGGNLSGTGNAGDSLLEELNRDSENQESANLDEDISSDDKQAWINAERWEPDPVEADPSKGSRNRRKIDILGMMVSVIGSKDQLVNEYRVMLAEKLLNKSDYDIDSEIRTLELLKIHFGESSMQRCEIMLNDLIDSKRTNTNIKASISRPSVNGMEEVANVSLDLLDATIISSNFWPPIQEESLKIPDSMDQLLLAYAKRFHEIKTPRKLLWKKNLGTVKLELEFEGRIMQFTVTPLHAAIITHFHEKISWTSKDLAAALEVSLETLNRRINFWVSKGILAESGGPECDDHVFTVIEDMIDANRNETRNGGCEEVLADEEAEKSVASVEEQLQKEMTIYERFITGMLTNIGSLTLDKIHNNLKMFYAAEPSYDKSLQQLQSFMSGLISEEKIEFRDGLYFVKK